MLPESAIMRDKRGTPRRVVAGASVTQCVINYNVYGFVSVTVNRGFQQRLDSASTFDFHARGVH